MSAYIEEMVKPIKEAPRVLDVVHQSDFIVFERMTPLNPSHTHLLKLIVIANASVEFILA